ncbi:DUF3846 domain-containing protein [Tsukamurella spumae]|uniref:DUF3846 domain-containing protein n=1 Tax=Tsukamurella spumae TaxID=44753 RepID=A0A846X3I4_9ACTN|nr:DUF3846 domain-containing protein [Tsukamurella spumae]NKY18889.1 DUF3846 domain-containing protein [Tsukamurella spumae]
MSVLDIGAGDYQAWQKRVGGTFDVMNIYRPDAGLVIHDEGKIIGLPLNRRASLLLWVHNSPFRGVDTIMGECLIVGAPDDEGETQSCPAELLESLTRPHGEWRYEVKVHGEPGWHGNQIVHSNVWDAYNDGLALAERWLRVIDVRVVPVAA